MTASSDTGGWVPSPARRDQLVKLPFGAAGEFDTGNGFACAKVQPRMQVIGAPTPEGRNKKGFSRVYKREEMNRASRSVLKGEELAAPKKNGPRVRAGRAQRPKRMVSRHLANHAARKCDVSTIPSAGRWPQPVVTARETIWLILMSRLDAMNVGNTLGTAGKVPLSVRKSSSETEFTVILYGCQCRLGRLIRAFGEKDKEALRLLGSFGARVPGQGDHLRERRLATSTSGEHHGRRRKRNTQMDLQWVWHTRELVLV